MQDSQRMKRNVQYDFVIDGAGTDSCFLGKQLTEKRA